MAPRWERIDRKVAGPHTESRWLGERGRGSVSCLPVLAENTTLAPQAQETREALAPQSMAEAPGRTRADLGLRTHKELTICRPPAIFDFRRPWRCRYRYTKLLPSNYVPRASILPQCGYTSGRRIIPDECP